MMSPVTPVVAQPSAARAGADLRAARERLGWSISDVAVELRIRQPHLEALEEGRLSLLPGHAYAMAFVRSYARLLGLDAEETVRRFKDQAGEAGRRTELVFPVPMPDRGLPAGAVALLGLVLAVGAYVGWYRLSAEGRLPAEAVTAIPERLAPLAEQALPPVAAPYATPSVVADAAATGALRIVPADTPAERGPSISPTSAAAAPAPRPDPTASGLAPMVTDDAGKLVLRANGFVWMLIRDKAGATVLNKTFRPGETWAVPAHSDLQLTTSNAGGMDILLDGTAIPSLGPIGTYRRRVPLDPDALISGGAPADVASIRAHQ